MMDTENNIEYNLTFHLIEYLDSYGLMMDLEKKSYEFSLELCNPNNIFPILDYTITIDPIKLGSISGNAFQLMLNEPIYFKNMMHNIVLLSLQTFTMNATIQYDQVQLQLYIDPLPIPIRHNAQMGLLCTLKVILIGHSDIQKFIRMSIWTCDQYCVNDITTLYKIPTSIMKCTHCRNQLKEQENSRIIGERSMAQMLITNQPLKGSFPLYRTIKVELLDDLCKGLELGAAYKLTGYLNINGIFKVMGIIQDCEKLPLYNISISLFPRINEVKNYSDSNSPYEFVYRLASQMGVEQRLAPQNLFTNFKMGILLSLASFKNDCNSTPLSILAVGFDSYFPNQLMSLTSKYAVRCVKPSPNDNMIGVKNKNDWYEIGSLSLANSGVCYLGDWIKYTTNKNGFFVKSALESGRIQLDEIGSYILPLKSSIWTYFMFQAKIKEQTELHTLINIFGIPFLSDPNDNDVFIRYILEQEINPNLDLNANCIIPENELTLYLRVVNSSTVVLTSSSEQLMKDYFVTCRRCRTGSFPARVFNSLLLFAESHAKLCLRSATTKHDAIIAIWLLEESIQAVYGVDIDNPCPKFSYEVDTIQSYFTLFEQWLHEFISTKSPS